MRRGESYKPEVIERLSVILKIPESKIREIIDKSKDNYEPVRLMRNASPEIVTKIEENLRDLPGVMLEVQPVRNYVNKNLAVHTLGYVGEISEYEIDNGLYKGLKAGSIIGKFGLERFYDNFLRGTDGSYREEVDVNGRVVKIMDKVDPKPGHDSITSVIEGVFARGDRRLGKALYLAWQRGAKFDGWSEHFSYDRWVQAISDAGLDKDFYATRERAEAEVFPWEHIQPGVSRQFLWNEYEKSKTGTLTDDCRHERSRHKKR